MAPSGRQPPARPPQRMTTTRASSVRRQRAGPRACSPSEAQRAPGPLLRRTPPPPTGLLGSHPRGWPCPGVGKPGLRTVQRGRLPPLRGGGTRGNLYTWITQPSDGEQLTLVVRIQWLLQHKHHAENKTCTIADVIFGQCEAPHGPPTMEHPSQWRYVATCLMAHMGSYSADDRNRPHWRWYHRAALRIQDAAGTASGRSRPPTPEDRAPRAGSPGTSARCLHQPRSPRRRWHAQAPLNSDRGYHPTSAPPKAHKGAPSGCLPSRGETAAVGTTWEWQTGGKPHGHRNNAEQRRVYRNLAPQSHTTPCGV